MIVCSSIWGNAWERYGKIFVDTYLKYWDSSINFILVTDRQLLIDGPKQLDLLSLKEYKEFMQHENTFDLQKIERKHRWKYDLNKWLPQVITPKAVISNIAWELDEILIWLDADVETHSPVNQDWILNIMDGYDIACLQRSDRHTEIGFYAIRLNNKTINIINELATLYTTFKITKYNEWHSAYTWDIAVATENVKINNLNTKDIKNHIFEKTILAEKLIHKKGDRKPGGGLAEYL